MISVGKIVGCSIFLFVSCFAMESDYDNSKALSFKVMTYNVCHVIGMADQVDKKHVSWSMRKARIIRQVLDESPDIVGFQEIRDEKNKSAVADLWKGLGNQGYDIITSRFSPSKLSEINTIAYKVNKFSCYATKVWELFDQPTYNYIDPQGRGRRRTFLMLSLKPVIVKIVNGIEDPYINDQHLPIHVVNVHNSMNYIDRMISNVAIEEKITAAIGKQGGIVILMGDFNNIPEQCNHDETKTFKQKGYKELLDDLKTEKGIPVSGTFIGYSYDKYQAPDGKLGSQIDHIFMKVLSSNRLTYKSSCHVNLNPYNGEDMSNAKTESDLLQGSRDKFCSDHAAGIADIVLYSKY